MPGRGIVKRDGCQHRLRRGVAIGRNYRRHHASGATAQTAIEQRAGTGGYFSAPGSGYVQPRADWSHAGYALRQADNSWRVYHNLNTCGTARSALYVQGLYEFLADELVNQQIAVLRPRGELNAALQELLHSPVKLNLFHSPRYNLIAWPFSGPYQNSNGWLLELFARANDSHIWSRQQARDWLAQESYQPSLVNVTLFERLGAKVVASNVFTDDQPDELLAQGKVGLNSGDSVIRFIARYSRAIPGCQHLNLPDSVCVFIPEHQVQ